MKQVESSSTVFYLPSHQLLLGNTPHTIGDILKKKETPSWQSPLPVELLISTVVDPTELVTAPLLSCQPVGSECVQLDLPLDVVGVFCVDTPLVGVAVTLKSAICVQLKAMEDAVLWKVSSFYDVMA